MKTMLLFSFASILFLIRCASPTINPENPIPSNQLNGNPNGLNNNVSDGSVEGSGTLLPDEFFSGLKCMEELGFYIANEKGRIDTNLTHLDLSSFSGLSADNPIFLNYNGVMSSSIHVKMKEPVGGNTFPDFWITRYLLGSQDEARRYFENVLIKLQDFDTIGKEPYVDMLSGKCCYTVWTRAHSFYYNYMPQILDCIDPNGKREIHLP